VKQYGETAVSAYKTLNLAVIGAGDLAVERAKTVVAQLRSQAVALPGEAQVQADLAVKDARTTAHQFAVAVRPEALRSTVVGLVETARTQALSTIEKLAEHGAEVVEDLRRQPAFRKVVRRAERAVDAVEDTLEDVLEETAEAVVEASNEVTSVAQKTAAKATKVAVKAEDKVEDAAEATKATAEKVVEAPDSGAEPVTAKSTTVKVADPATSAPVKKSTPAARKSSPAKATSARVTRARTAKPADPTAVPAKKN
jgi:heparin binding hemagglutinin HbhA